ncbi:MAG: magnesium/cobalt transporter CorA [Actinobacteria bacterium]|nr:magnesium/cobalt transporter CorA [Actinomycetota bacterium]
MGKMKVLFSDGSGAVNIEEKLDDVDLKKCKVFWVDLLNPDKEELGTVTDFLGLHPITFKSYEEKKTIPSVQQFQEYLKINWDFIDGSGSDEELNVNPIILLLGDNYLVTVHERTMPEIDEVVNRWIDEPSVYHQSSAPLLYDILDTAVDGYFPIVEDLSDRIDRCIDRLMTSSSQEDLQTIMSIKHENMTMRRTLMAHRDVMMQLSRRDMPHIPRELYEYLVHVYDHLVRVGMEVENNSDLVSSTLDIYLSSVSNRLNITMKRLTTIATIFMPLTFIVGLYGMNFKYMPEFNWHYGYAFAWGTIIVTTVVMIILARKYDWF